MARLCIALGMTPAEYRALTLWERDALVAEHNAQHGG